MPDIPLPQPESPDIYSYGFDKSLNRTTEPIQSPVVYDTLNTVDPAIISKGDLAVSTLSIANKGVVVANDTSKGLQIGNVLSGNQYLAPFDVANDGKGTIRRVGAIQIASAADLGVTSIEPATTTKTIWANGGEIRLQSGTNGYIRHRRTGTTTDLFSYVKSGLTNSSANSIFTLSLLATEYSGGVIDWLVIATDGTDYQATSGRSSWAAVNKGGVYTTNITDDISSTAPSAGTLTGVWSIITATNQIRLQFTPTSSLTTALVILYTNFHSLNAQALTQN